jgi:hypothetical protein
MFTYKFEAAFAGPHKGYHKLYMTTLFMYDWFNKILSIPSNDMMKSFLFWETIPRSQLKVDPLFKGICHIHLKGQRISEGRNQQEAGSKLCSACYLSYPGFLPGTFINLNWKVSKRKRFQHNLGTISGYA